MTDLCLGRCSLCYNANECSCPCHEGKREPERDLDWPEILKRVERNTGGHDARSSS